MTQEQRQEAEKFLSENETLVEEYLQYTGKRDNEELSPDDFDLEFLYINVMAYKICKARGLLDDDEKKSTIPGALG